MTAKREVRVRNVRTNRRRPGDRELPALEALYREQDDEFRSGETLPDAPKVAQPIHRGGHAVCGAVDR